MEYMNQAQMYQRPAGMEQPMMNCNYERMMMEMHQTLMGINRMCMEMHQMMQEMCHHRPKDDHKGY
ncbi:MAG: hypothetical protein GXY86_14360 [Firmicutes bacterium]|nr:hypothetical protein [Bacillota bacterium]